MPGEDLESALAAAATLAQKRMGTVLTNLGERVASPAEAAAVEQQYRDVATAVGARHLPAHVSVKLTHLGLSLDRDACTRRVTALAEVAARSGSFLWIDMEESEYVNVTLDIFKQVRATQSGIGVCLPGLPASHTRGPPGAGATVCRHPSGQGRIPRAADNCNAGQA